MNPQALKSLQTFADIRIEHPLLLSAESMIRRIIEQSKGLPEPINAVMVGEAGCGKSTVCQRIVASRRRHPTSTAEGTTYYRSVILVEVPSPVTVGALATAILTALGDLRPGSGTVAQKTARMIKLLNESGTELILLDEFQHLFTLAAGTNVFTPAVKVVQNWLKSLINHTRIPVVLVGMPTCEDLVKGDSQLRRRFQKKAVLKNLTLSEGPSSSPFLSFAASLSLSAQQIIGFKQVPDVTKAFGARLFAATSGNPSQTTLFYREAAALALEEARTTLDIADFAKAFDENMSATCLMGDVNPFASAIDSVMGRLRVEGHC